MSTLAWQRVRIPPVERLVLSDIADRRGVSDEDALVEMIREAARREAAREEVRDATRA